MNRFVLEKEMRDMHEKKYWESKTETLEDALKDLCEFAPDSFAHSGGLMYCYGSNKAEEWIPVSGQDDWRNSARIQAACQEECEARDWQWSIRSHKNGYSAEINEGYSRTSSRVVNSPALAIATALRDALRAEQ